MALSNPAFSACRAFQTKKNSKGKIREGGPEDSGRRAERRASRNEVSSYSEAAQGTGRAQKRGPRSQHGGPDRCKEMSVQRQGAAWGKVANHRDTTLPTAMSTGRK